MGLDRPRLAQRVVEVVEAALVAEPLAVEQPPHDRDRLVQPIESLADAGTPFLDPNAACSRSNHAPPIPSTARPWLTLSSVVASFAVIPG